MEARGRGVVGTAWLWSIAAVAAADLLFSGLARPAAADGMAVVPADYEGSVEERSQEAIIIFHAAEQPGEAREDLILKITVAGGPNNRQAVEHFAWVVPFPNQPKAAKEDAALFKELFDYAEARAARPKSGGETAAEGAVPAAPESRPPVEVLSRKIVGSFDVAVVRENTAGGLNGWLKENGYRTLDDADDVLDFYRQKRYVYACIKVSDAELSRGAPVELHPLRFSFKTGGRDGIYFPMKLTGLQSQPFDVNLYVFYGKWINDHRSKFGYENRGFRLKYRDWDTAQCTPNAGKQYSAPQNDVFLTGFADRLPAVIALMQKLHPGERYYLTNIQAFGMKPEAVRQWADDLWLFPYYLDRSFVPFDARPGGPAEAAWPGSTSAGTAASSVQGLASAGGWAVPEWLVLLGGGAGVAVLAALTFAAGVAYARRR